MNTHLRSLPLPGAVRPVREHGSSALDRIVTPWPAPDSATRVIDCWGAPAGAQLGASPWPAPDPVMRFDLPAPDPRRVVTAPDGRIPWADLIEPRYAVTAPNLHVASRAAIVAPPVTSSAPNWSAPNSSAPSWPAPTLAAAAPIAPPEPERSSIATRVVVGLAAAAGALVAGAAVFIALF